MKLNEKYVKGIVFDLGDTLIETGALMRAGATHAADRLCSENLISEKENLVSAFFSVDEQSSFPHINHLFSHIEIVQKALETSGTLRSNASLSTATVAGIFLAHYRDKIRQSIYPQMNLASLLKKLRECGFRLGVISNGTLEEQIEVLTRMEIIRCFDDILISEEVGLEKPDPRIFQIAAKRLNVEPRSILFIGDSWDVDVLGAASAGFQVALSVQFRNDEPNQENRFSKHMVLHQVEDILQLLNIR